MTLGFCVLCTTCIFFELTGCSGFALNTFLLVTDDAGFGIDFGATTIFFFALTRSHQRTGAGVALFVCQCAQNNA